MPRSFFCEDDINFGRAAQTGFEPFDNDVSMPLDPRTGRPWGDHGTATQAIEYAFNELDGDFEAIEFLRNWREGDVAEEWPDFYGWLTEQE